MFLLNFTCKSASDSWLSFRIYLFITLSWFCMKRFSWIWIGFFFCLCWIVDLTSTGPSLIACDIIDVVMLLLWSLVLGCMIVINSLFLLNWPWNLSPFLSLASFKMLSVLSTSSFSYAILKYISNFSLSSAVIVLISSGLKFERLTDSSMISEKSWYMLIHHQGNWTQSHLL